MEGREGSLPFMDVDSLPDDMLGVDDMFLDSYLKNMEGAHSAEATRGRNCWIPVRSIP